MSKKNNPTPGKGKPAPKADSSEPLTIESLLDDIELEESQMEALFPGISDSIEELDDLGDFDTEPTAEGLTGADDDFDDFDDLDDLGELDDLDGFDDFDDFDDDEATPDEPEENEPTDEAAEEKTDRSKATFADVVAALKGLVLGNSGDGEKKNNRPLLLAIIGLLIILIIVLLMQNCGSCERGGKNDDWFDTSAIEGTLPGKTPEEIQAMLDQIVEEGMFNVSIAPVIIFEDAEGMGQARIENIPANHYNMSVKITLDKTAETVYQSKGIRPGQYIEYITLQKVLQPGEYDATALFSAHDADSLKEQGRVAVKIKIIVE